jgi:hypothetical protein
MLYEISLTHEIETPKGVTKQVCEKYLYDAELVSECEARSLEEIPDCEVICVCRSKIIEVVNENIREGAYYKAKITQTTTNDDGSESSKSYFILCNAESLPKATKIFQEHLKGTIEDATLDSITKTRIIDILA